MIHLIHCLHRDLYPEISTRNSLPNAREEPYQVPSPINHRTFIKPSSRITSSSNSSNDPPRSTPMDSFIVNSALHSSWILNNMSWAQVCQDSMKYLFVEEQDSADGTATGNICIEIRSPNGSMNVNLSNVHYIPIHQPTSFPPSSSKTHARSIEISSTHREHASNTSGKPSAIDQRDILQITHKSSAKTAISHGIPYVPPHERIFKHVKVEQSNLYSL